jgi:ComF family protein
MKMPKTGFGERRDNPICQLFWGRVPVSAGTSLFRFEKGSAYQALIHDLKYRGNRKAGLYLGRLLGLELKRGVYSTCDLMVPVPLHQRRLRQRGYNQSELIARGVSEITKIPVNADLIRRKRYQHSQTSMNREKRFENMENAFTLNDSPPDLHNKKILLIDDIITTGATLEACSVVLLNRYDCSVYVASLSYA